MSIMHELSRLQEVIDVISEHTKDAAVLPQAGEQVLVDLKASNTTWKYQVHCCLFLPFPRTLCLPQFVGLFVNRNTHKVMGDFSDIFEVTMGPTTRLSRVILEWALLQGQIFCGRQFSVTPATWKYCTGCSSHAVISFLRTEWSSFAAYSTVETPSAFQWAENPKIAHLWGI